ncbi:hypothetical protein JW992_03140 [candidate division KSB1 bacterium]|nr:hypothetical protein [candidate division KSB1 bacterium]
MKSKKWILIALLVASASAQAQKNNSLKIGDREFGVYVGVGGRSSSVFSQNAGYLDLKGAVMLNDKWNIGLTCSGLWYDKALDQLVDDGTYHLYVAYGGLFVERLFTLNSNLRLVFSLMSGTGEAYYQYDRDYRKDKVWSEEVIDKASFGVQEVGIEIQQRLSKRLWLGVTGTYRNTSPLELIDTDKDLLKNAGAGIMLKYDLL